MPFLTALSPNARLQGSRDPLGLLPVWSRLGRRAIANVTTVSADLRGWTTLLLATGMHEHGVAQGWWRDDDLEPFYRAEQLIAFAREAHGRGQAVRGIGRVRIHLRAHDDGRTPIPLGRSRERRILQNQRGAGVWGQIAASAQKSQLLDPKQLRLAGQGRTLWERVFAPRLAPHQPRWRRILADEHGFAPKGRDATLAKALDALTGPTLHPVEVTIYRDRILHGGTSDGPQAQLVALLRKHLDAPMTQPHLRALAEEAGPTTLLGRALTDMAHAEAALGPIESLFAWLLARDRQPLAQAVRDLEQAWPSPLRHASDASDALLLAPVQDAYGNDAPELLKPLKRARDALAAGTMEPALRAVIQLNEAVMGRRGGAPWVRIDGTQLDVRLGTEDAADLPSPDAAAERLVHSYYLEPLQRLTRAWVEGQ